MTHPALFDHEPAVQGTVDRLPYIDRSDTSVSVEGHQKWATPQEHLEATDAARALAEFANDNRIVRTDRPTSNNRNVQPSAVSIDDAGAITGVTTLNGVTVEGHGARHAGGGADPIPYDNSGSGLAATDYQDAIDELKVLVDALGDGMVFEGAFDAGGGAGPVSFPGAGAAPAGAFYVVENAAAGTGTVVGTVNPITVHTGDKLVAALDNASTTDGDEWVKLDDTDAVSSVAGKTGAVVLVTGDITSVEESSFLARAAGIGTGAAQKLTPTQARALLAYTAAIISYDNSGSGLTAINIQDAIDELDTTVDAHAAALAGLGTDDVEDDSAHGQASLTAVLERVALLRAPPIGGRYICPADGLTGTVVGTQGLAAGTISSYRCTLEECPQALALVVNVTTAVGGSNLRLCIYEDDAGLPGAVIAQSGDISSAANGLATFTFGSPLDLSWSSFHVAVRASAAISLEAFSAAAFSPVLGCSSGVSSFAASAWSTVRVESGSYGAFPDPASPTGYARPNPPVMALLLDT